MTDATVPATDAGHDAGAIAHIMSFRTLAGVFLTLLVLTVITVTATRLDLGSFNLLLAISIATVKAALVVLYFMHLRYDNPFYALILLTGLMFLALFLGGTLMDTLQYQPDIERLRETQPL